MPFDSAGVVLTVSRRGARRQPQHYPQLATQIRCPTGFTVVASGRLEVLPPRVRANEPGPSAPSASMLHLLAVLESLAREGATLPTRSRLAEEMGPGWRWNDVVDTVKALERAGLLRLALSEPGQSFWLHSITIVSTGAVLVSRRSARRAK